MAGRTHSERIETVEKEVLRHGYQLRSLEDRFQADVDFLKGEVRRLEEKLSEGVARFAVLEQRCAHLEKLVDEIRTRRWQIWLAFLGAFLSAAVALILVLVKK